MNEWNKNLKTDDMPNEDLKLVAERCGVETALSLLYNLPGLSLYIPKDRKGISIALEEKIKKEYDGSTESVKAIALKYNITEAAVYGKLKKAMKKDSLIMRTPNPSVSI